MTAGAHTQYGNATEATVARLLETSLPPDARYWPNLRVTDRRKDHELDFVVAVPGAGMVVLEVKGGQVSFDGQTWRQTHSDGTSKRIHPVDQARDGKYALRGYVEGDPRWGSRGRVRWGHAVVFPYTDIPQGFSTPDCPRDLVFGRGDLAGLIDAMAEIPVRHDSAHRAPDQEEIELLAEILRGRGFPQTDLIGFAAERVATAELLTEQQGLILDVSKLVRRMEIRGGAGSGKTWLALEQARRLGHSGQRVALVCYSRGLAAYFRRVTRNWPRKDKPAYVGTFHGLGTDVWGAEVSELDDDDSEYWEERLPTQMVQLAAALDPVTKFDAIVVDEAQDFADAWWPAVLSALKDADEGRLTIMSDEGQRVFARFGGVPECQVVLTLEQNLRNTRQIADSFQSLALTRMRNRGGEGPDVRFVECAAEAALDVADEQVDRMLDEGWRPQDVALLTVGSRHPEQVARQEEGQDEYWGSFWDDDQVFYGHVLGFKGLERSVVVLALNEGESRELSRERLYVGLSRARDCLVVCGDPAYVEAVGGPGVVRKLRPAGAASTHQGS